MYKIKMLESDWGLIKDSEYIVRTIYTGLKMNYVYDLEGMLIASVPDSELLYEMVL